MSIASLTDFYIFETINTRKVSGRMCVLHVGYRFCLFFRFLYLILEFSWQCGIFICSCYYTVDIDSRCKTFEGL